MLTDEEQDYFDKRSEKSDKLLFERAALSRMCEQERVKVSGLFAELGAVGILRKHLPRTLQHRVDELEWTLRHIEQIEAHLAGWPERAWRLEEAERTEELGAEQEDRIAPDF